MSPESVQARAFFIDAVENVSPERWREFLDEACGADLALRDKVQRLLDAHGAISSFMDRPAAAPVPTIGEPLTEKPGTQIGPYKLLQQLGEGGMGVVYLAEQKEPVNRRVALKIIKPGMDTRQVIARFEAERQVLALMDHPNIAKVLDAGATDSGRPFFVMELVNGRPVTDYCDEQQMTPRQRMELFLPICRAVQHAHQKGIIHRDLKPSNVLVALYDGKAVPKVIDFGVAKATGQTLTEKTMFTQFGQVVGTLEYMSPEQAEPNQLDIDTRSDIYTLGVLMYELLTGTTPFDKQRLRSVAWDEMLRIIREEEPPKPSLRLSQSHESRPSISAMRHTEPARLTKFVRGELDWIVMKALEKDRARRYDTAVGLANDIERYLNDEPVQASPPSKAYRIWKFARRNRPQVAAATTLLAILLASVVLVSLHNRQLSEKDGELLAAIEAVKQAKGMAQQRGAEIDAVLDFVETKIFAAARPEAWTGGLGHDVRLADAVKASLPFVETSFADKPLIEARLRRTIGLSFRYLGDARSAIEQHEKALALMTRYRGADDPYTLATMMALSDCYSEAGRVQEALQLREETLKHQKSTLGPDHADTLGSMVNLAISYDDIGRIADSIKLYEEVLPRLKMRDHPFALNCMHNLASSYLNSGRNDDAIQLYEETFRLMKSKFGPDYRSTLVCMESLAFSYLAAGHTQQALPLYEETLAIMKSKLGPDHPITLSTMMGLSESYASAGRHADALRLCEESFPKWEAMEREGNVAPYDRACWRSQISGLIRATDSSPEGVERAATLADESMGWLANSVAGGFQDPWIEKDKALDPLRDREDFKELLLELRAKREGTR
jgi:serine/threonine protein kinase